MSFFSDLLAGFKTAITTVESVGGPILSVVEGAAPIVEEAFPQTIPVIGVVEGAVASVTKLEPSAVSSAGSAISAIESIIAAGSAEVQQLEALFGSLGKATTVGQAVVVTPTTTAATVPAK